MEKNILLDIQQRLNVEKTEKETKGKYNYWSNDYILSKVKPMLHAEGCVIEINDTLEECAGVPFIVSSITIRKKDELISATKAAVAVDVKPQIMSLQQSCKASSTFARKAALEGMFALADTRKDESKFHQKTGKPIVEPETDRWQQIVEALISEKYTIDQIEKKYYISENTKAEILREVEEGKHE